MSPARLLFRLPSLHSVFGSKPVKAPEIPDSAAAENANVVADHLATAIASLEWGCTNGVGDGVRGGPPPSNGPCMTIGR